MSAISTVPAGRSRGLDRHNVQLGFLLAVRTGDRLQDRLRHPAVESKELVVPERGPAGKQAGVVPTSSRHPGFAI